MITSLPSRSLFGIIVSCPVLLSAGLLSAGESSLLACRTEQVMPENVRQEDPRPQTVLCGNTLAKEAERPNILLVFIDDMGWGDFSCFGNTHVQTEHIDRLASEGVRFEQFYVNSPICSPSRTAISTGQYPQRWRITSYLNNRQSNIDRGMAQWLDLEAPMLARLLGQSGYATGHFGKWHMGGQRDVGEAPLITEYGFDASLTNFEGLGPRVLPLCDAYDGKPPRKHALGSDQLGRGPITLGEPLAGYRLVHRGSTGFH